MRAERLTWQHDGKTVELGADWSGDGPTVLLLPALSSISTRLEMRPLQERLAPNYRTVAVDWPGFGAAPRPPCDWRPAAYAEFLAFIVGRMEQPVHAVIAAGHGATFALAHAAAHPQALSASSCWRRLGAGHCRQ